MGGIVNDECRVFRNSEVGRRIPVERVLRQSWQRVEWFSRRLGARRWWPQGRWLGLSLLATLADETLWLPLVLGSLAYGAIASGRSVSLAAIAPHARRLQRSLLHLAKTPLGAGTLAFASTYALAAAWSELEGNWAAIVLTGLALLNGLLLVRELAPQPQKHPAVPVSPFGETQWQNLSASAPLDRLMAVRSLLHSVLDDRLSAASSMSSADVRSHLADCFQLMLTQETDPIVQRALWEGLQRLHPVRQLPEGQPAIAPPGGTTVAFTSTPKRTVEYLEP